LLFFKISFWVGLFISLYWPYWLLLNKNIKCNNVDHILNFLNWRIYRFGSMIVTNRQKRITQR
jgi:hypothetical protein